MHSLHNYHGSSPLVLISTSSATVMEELFCSFAVMHTLSCFWVVHPALDVSDYTSMTFLCIDRALLRPSVMWLCIAWVCRRARFRPTLRLPLELKLQTFSWSTQLCHQGRHAGTCCQRLVDFTLTHASSHEAVAGLLWMRGWRTCS